MRLAQREHLAQLRHTADFCHAGLRNTHRARLEQALELKHVRDVFACRDRCRTGAAQPCEPAVVVRRIHRLFDPRELKVSPLARLRNRFVNRPRARAIHHQRYRRPAGLAGRAHDVTLVFMQLDQPIAAPDGFGDFAHHHLFIAIAQQACIRRQRGSRAAAEQLVQRHAGALGRDIPQRDIHARHRKHHRPAAPRVIEAAMQVSHDLRNLRRVFIQAARRNDLLDRGARALPTRIGKGLAPAGNALVRFHLDQQGVHILLRRAARMRHSVVEHQWDAYQYRFHAGDFHCLLRDVGCCRRCCGRHSVYYRSNPLFCADLATGALFILCFVLRTLGDVLCEFCDTLPASLR